MLQGVRGDFPTGEAGARGAFPPKNCVFSGGAGDDPPIEYSMTTCYFVFRFGEKLWRLCSPPDGL